MIYFIFWEGKAGQASHTSRCHSFPRFPLYYVAMVFVYDFTLKNILLQLLDFQNPHTLLSVRYNAIWFKEPAVLRTRKMGCLPHKGCITRITLNGTRKTI